MKHLILLTAAACILLELCSGTRGEDCGTCATAGAGCAACKACTPWWQISDRGWLARAIGAQRCCAQCATIPCCCPDDYCPKPEPCVPCVPRSCCPDDYCPKPAPCLCVPMDHHFFRCVSPCETASGDSGCKRPGY